MKPYFSKLLTEQERAGSRNRSTKWGLRLQYDPDSDYEDQPTRVKMCRRNRITPTGDYNWKELTDVLSPLHGYLRKNVGRPWDDVYSELCEGLDRRSVSGLHVFTHLWQFVDKHTVMCNDGKVRAWASFGGYLSLPDDYYVHPYTGILCESERHYRYRRDKERHPDRVFISNNSSYIRFDGIWYYVEYRQPMVIESCSTYIIEIPPIHYGTPGWKESQGLKVVITKKRQLGKKQLRFLKLQNAGVV